MDNFKAVYKILSQLEKDLDKDQPNLEQVSAEALCISERRWISYIEMMADVGYIKGARIVRDVTGDVNIDCSNMKITLRGLEYLQENSIMRRMYKAAKGIKDITPGA